MLAYLYRLSVFTLEEVKLDVAFPAAKRQPDLIIGPKFAASCTRALGTVTQSAERIGYY